ncbi:hypothetical protein TSOC_007803 [Tetrabaena socialis]|uniref:Uncharacterized protein n=1 Tax=Tetrabaena socialis TaxID=47790 RepID=A0A2J8A041_9CHLO|nr:hypothetical protein TSOC_007803 [Tetrabaena socialis]|eukprot:PNH05893.1 hypothetical protein TSOC_007803 [Tetrabaena socialis]
MDPAERRVICKVPEARELSLTATGQRRVVPVEAPGGGGGGGGGGGLPAPPEEALPPLASLTRAAPSPLLPHHLLEVLYGYCYVVRQYGSGGGWTAGGGGSAAAAAAALLALTDVLAGPSSQRRRPRPRRRPHPAAVARGGGGGGREGAVAIAAKEEEEDEDEEGAPALRLPHSAAEACLHVMERACCPPLGTSQDRPLAVAVLRDVVTVMGNGRSSMLLALADARRLVLAAAAEVTAAAEPGPAVAARTAGAGGGPGAGRGAGSLHQHARHRADAAAEDAAAAAAAAAAAGRAERGVLAVAERKLWFLLSWANELKPEQVDEACAAVAAEWAVQQASVAAGGAPVGGLGGGEVEAGAGGAPRPGEVRVR